MRNAVLCVLAVLGGVALAAPLPYNAAADAKADVQQALSAATSNHVPVLIVFGANWCEDCRSLDRDLHKGPNVGLMAQAFTVVKVDVGNFDRNLDIATAYGNPIAKGIPAVVVVSEDNKVLYSSKAGELADARRMSTNGVYAFFKRLSDSLAQTR